MADISKQIAVLASSAACPPERFEKALQAAIARGYQVEVLLDPVREYGRTQHLFSSASAEARSAAFVKAMGRGDLGALVAARGAYGAIELLPLIDFYALRGTRVPFVGYSDTTLLLLQIYSRSNALAVHGPCFEGLFSQLDNSAERRESLSALEYVLAGGQINYDVRLEELFNKPSKVEGPLIGGNLSILSSLIGTKYDVGYDDHILFLEDVGEKPHRVHRLVSQMKLAGKLDRVKAVLLGDFIDCDHLAGKGPDLRMVLSEVFAGLSVPVFQGFPAGHTARNLALRLGSWYHLSANGLVEDRAK